MMAILLSCRIIFYIVVSMLLMYPFHVGSFVIVTRNRNIKLPLQPLLRHVSTETSVTTHQYAKTLEGGKSKENLEQEEKPKLDPKELFQKLDDSFDYDGRLPSKVVSGGVGEQQVKDDEDTAVGEYVDDDEFRCGFVSIVGAPNMGKSTLMNALIQEDLCVATRRPQTTRHAIMGVTTTSNCQLCLVDTPGVIDNPAYMLQEGMMEAVVGAFHDADVLLVVTDLFSTPIPDDDLFAKVQRSSKPVVVVINKIDLADKVNPDSDENNEEGRTVTVPEAVAKWRSLLPDAVAIIPVSAEDGPNNVGVIAVRNILLGDGDVPASIRDLGRPVAGMFPPGVKTITKQIARSLLPSSPPLYHEETLTDRPERFFASEIVRASLFQILKKELPYACEVRITEFKEPPPGSRKNVIRMKADILVERDSQKIIVIGKGGDQIKKIGTSARQSLEEFFQTQIYLELNVKVEKNWRKDVGKLKEYGYLKNKKKK